MSDDTCNRCGHKLGLEVLPDGHAGVWPSLTRTRVPVCPCTRRVPVYRCFRSLGIVDLIGTTYSEDFLATGFGGHLAIPLIRDRWRADLTEEEARQLLEDCMRVLFYRDCRASNKVP